MLHGFIISFVTIFGFPTADTTISAIIVYSLIFLVFELQTVTVAHSFMKSIDKGFPTILLLQIITTFFHTSEILYCSRSLLIHFGVHEISPELSHKNNFQIFSFVNQSTSFAGFIRLIIFCSLICLGSGNCTINQLIFLSSLNLIISFSSLS